MPSIKNPIKYFKRDDRCIWNGFQVVAVSNTFYCGPIFVPHAASWRHPQIINRTTVVWYV